jgi:hypothetical protein
MSNSKHNLLGPGELDFGNKLFQTFKKQYEKIPKGANKKEVWAVFLKKCGAQRISLHRFLEDYNSKKTTGLAAIKDPSEKAVTNTLVTIPRDQAEKCLVLGFPCDTIEIAQKERIP